MVTANVSLCVRNPALANSSFAVQLQPKYKVVQDGCANGDAYTCILAATCVAGCDGTLVMSFAAQKIANCIVTLPADMAVARSGNSKIAAGTLVVIRLQGWTVPCISVSATSA
mmetsp:Transcript_17610/g.43026  ORF Transcript_17610/g.43026 Transcript_17610/m.43026 type:complete len:113 (+) Transcript_17610:101-439(+)